MIAMVDPVLYNSNAFKDTDTSLESHNQNPTYDIIHSLSEISCSSSSPPCVHVRVHVHVLFSDIVASTTASSLSCWCLMLQELFKHSLSVPHVRHVTSNSELCQHNLFVQNFLSGLMIFTELLPLPLPVQVPQVIII